MLEKLFDVQICFRDPPNTKNKISTLLHEKINVGIESDPKFVNIGLGCSSMERKTLINLFKRYHDIFSWTSHDLQKYDMQII